MFGTRQLVLIFVILVVLLPGAASGQGREIGFEETFALAKDRRAAIEQLIPGTVEYYYYSCLERQHAGRHDEVPALLKTWVDRHGRSRRVEEIENRQALLTFAESPESAWRFLRDRLGLRFDHERVVPGARPDLPTRLDQELISIERLTTRALTSRPNSLDGFHDSALPRLVARELSPVLLRALLARLERPDVPNLAALVVRDLEAPHSSGFGSLKVHSHLLLAQLEECARLRPELLRHEHFINTYLIRMQPRAGASLRDDATREAYLDRLEAFTARLSSAQNSVKAHVLHHRLEHDLARGAPDKQRFLRYLRLPRNTSWCNPERLERRHRDDALVEPAKDFATRLGKIGNDDDLVRAYFEHLFRTEGSFMPYAEWVRESWLRRVFAETKILSGEGDKERWYSLLNDPAYYERLKERVEIRFAPTRRTYFGATDPVSLDVRLKNVGTLLVKVFEINALNYYRDLEKDVDASINIDGLIASRETSHSYEEVSPFVRHERRFDFPTLERPGVYVVELIGNGISSRAVIRKGRLRYTERSGPAGHVLRVLDEGGRILRDATVRLGGREYAADDVGNIRIPYSTSPGNKKIILRHGEMATLETLPHRGEGYVLEAGVQVDREALLAGNDARLLVRPNLLLNGLPLDLSVLEEPKLSITSVDIHGTSSSLELRDLELRDDRCFTHEIHVPTGLASLTVTLGGRVKSLTTGKPIALTTRAQGFKLNEIEGTKSIESPLLGRTASGWFLDVLGKNGEPVPDRAVECAFTHRDFADPVTVSLKTDARGRIELGVLDGITRVGTSGLPKGYTSWALRPDDRTLPARIHARAGDVIRIPYQGSARTATRRVASLLERRAGRYMRDAFAHVSLKDGFVELRDLAPGDYDLWLPEAGHGIGIQVDAGELRDGWVNAPHRMLEVQGARPLHITELAVESDELVIRCANANAATRVHVFASRYVSPYDAFSRFSITSPPDPAEVTLEATDSIYASGRSIGEEYRYILDRRLAKKYPGNMLARPGLLLNPWALEETRATIGLGGGAGGEFGGRRGGRGRRARGAGRRQAGETGAPGVFATLDFLQNASTLKANLVPDANGVVRVRLADLGEGQHVHALALDGTQTVYAQTAVAEKPLAARDRRLAETLDVGKHYAETRGIEFVGAGSEAVVRRTAGSAVEAYDSLESVFNLYRTLGGGAALSEFAFVLRWPEMGEEEKLETYSKNACHELHFFLYRKDPAFFQATVRPYLANKVDRTFLDEWLLEEDLTAYLEPWRFSRLNIVEKILLTHRLEGRAAAGTRHVTELVELVPVGEDHQHALFKSVLAGDALSRGGNKDLAFDKLPAPKRALDRSMDEKAKGLQQQGQRPGKPGRDRRAWRQDEDGIADDPAELEEQEVDEDLENLKEEGRSNRRKAVRRERDQAERLYRAPDRTRRYAEHNYRHRPIGEQGPDLVEVNAFWRDLAAHGLDGGFFSSSFPQASRSFCEMMFALSFLDLPFKAGEHEITRTDDRITVKAATPMLLVRKELKEVGVADDALPLLVSQAFFRVGDQYRWVGNERRDKFVTDEFLIGVPYGCRVVVTNPTSTPRKLDVLAQIPGGSMPLERGSVTRGFPAAIAPYGTSTYEFFFYFPAAGTFDCYPVHTAQAGETIAAAEPFTMKVVRELSTVDVASWEHISQSGSAQQVLDHLSTNNLQRTDLSKIAWRLKDRGFFGELVDLLRKNHAYSDVLWSYGVLHRDARVTEEFLAHQGFLGRCGPWLDSPLAKIDPVERRAYQHIEYSPLFNGRAHRFGKRRRILDEDLARQYTALMRILCYRPALDDTDRMSATYYLLLQDRVEEALAQFESIDPRRLDGGRLQYDYMRAYTDFYLGETSRARDVAARHRDHPVKRWRAVFRDVLNQLDEIEGSPVAMSDTDDRTQQQTAAAANEPSLALKVESRVVNVLHDNLEQCTVNFYEMDVEFLFSSSPFVQNDSGAFSYVKPNKSVTLDLRSGDESTTLDLPSEYANANVLVEVRAGGLVKRQSYYANSLAVRVAENFGQLRVTHTETGAALSKVYVKVFARTESGGVRFHKDGYTDLRGRFDYASLTGSGAQDARRYSILVLSESDGAVIREVAPPTE